MFDKYQLKTLENGLKTLLVPMETSSATVLLLLGAGSRYETKEENGISHFLEHMAFKGTKKYPSSFALASAIEGIGGEFNAFTSKDHTGYWIKAAASKLPLLLSVLSDMVINPLLQEEEIMREKGVIIEEINMYEDTPMRKIETEYEMLMYGDTPLGWDIAGRKKVIESLNRQNFLSYINRLYSPSNAVLAIAGQTKKLTLSEIEKYFHPWKEHKTSTFEKVDYKQDKPKVKVVYKQTEQAHLCLGVPAIKLTDPRRYALSLLGIVLGGGMSSRLFIEVRERRGLAYYVRADANKYVDTGNFVVAAGIQIKSLQEAVKVILNQLKVTNYELRVKDKELQRAKEHLKGNLILSLEDSRSVAGLYGSSLLLEKEIKTPSEIIDNVEKVTLDEVNQVSSDLFKAEKLNLAVIGPFKNEEQNLKTLLESSK